MPPSEPKETSGQPWGRIAGLAAWCIVTLAGFILNLDPDVVLVAALVAALGSAVIALVGKSVLA